MKRRIEECLEKWRNNQDRAVLLDEVGKV